MKTKQKRKPASRRRSKRLTVLDLFAGAGGFSEGFRSAGFLIKQGIEKYGPAVDTFNCNFGLKQSPRDILYFEQRPERIEELPDTDVIIGSPPCVSFSYSNRFWSGDKSHGIRLIKVFLAIVAVKKHKPNSRLKGWFMENVPKALEWMKPAYTFRDLGLTAWSRELGLDPRSIAVSISDNARVVDAADYGVPQVRKRLFVHEYLRQRGSRHDWLPRKRRTRLTLGSTALRLPKPTCALSWRPIRDPLYAGIQIPLANLTDHFYETGAYELHWRESRYLKRNHPYMGRMSFPERKDKPSRTIVASHFPRAREALLYNSEWNRRSNGKYRRPTIREVATLMGFPITYQFYGPESTKWTLVGNAVCPLLARQLAQRFLKRLGRNQSPLPRKVLPRPIKELPNLNTFKPAKYANPPVRNKLSRFRRHPFKTSGMAVTLSNYDLKKNGAADGTWRCSVTYGIGKGYKIQSIKPATLPKIVKAVRDLGPVGHRFSHFIRNGFKSKVAPGRVMQDLYEKNSSLNGYENPSVLIDRTGPAIQRFVRKDQDIDIKPKLFLRPRIPKSQLFALLAISQIAHAAQVRRGKSR